MTNFQLGKFENLALYQVAAQYMPSSVKFAKCILCEFSELRIYQAENWTFHQ